jgi:hypothetical protein
MERVMIQLPKGIKAKLDALRAHGTTPSGLVRTLVKREFRQTTIAKAGR